MLSIVVPAYNEGEHIYDNLAVIDKSVSRITPDYEIVAVNDGSKDNTGAEVARAASENPHIRDCGYEVNRGKGGAVTWGINNSRGDIVGFLDADLDLNPDMLGRRIHTRQSGSSQIETSLYSRQTGASRFFCSSPETVFKAYI